MTGAEGTGKPSWGNRPVKDGGEGVKEEGGCSWRPEGAGPHSVSGGTWGNPPSSPTRGAREGR